MKERIFSRKFWQKVFNYQLIIWFLLMISYTFSQRNNHFYFIGDLFNLAFSTAIMGLNFYVQFKKDSSKTNTQIVRWLTIVIFPFNFCQIWHITGNFLLKTCRLSRFYQYYCYGRFIFSCQFQLQLYIQIPKVSHPCCNLWFSNFVRPQSFK